MTKYYKVACFATAAAWTCLAAAQSSPARLSTPPPADPLKTATKPLTPKSAAPVHHKSSVVLPQKPAGKENTNAELTRLERQKTVLSGSPKSGSPSAPKSTSPAKPADTAAGSGPAIDYKYQKPAGGKQADTPNARTPNATTPRVTKRN
jgi:hypothetical protein